MKLPFFSHGFCANGSAMLTNTEILQIALRQSAIDSCCVAEDFIKSENVVALSRENAGRRAYIAEPYAFDLTSYGGNVVACVREGVALLNAAGADFLVTSSGAFFPPCSAAGKRKKARNILHVPGRAIELCAQTIGLLKILTLFEMLCHNDTRRGSLIVTLQNITGR